MQNTTNVTLSWGVIAIIFIMIVMVIVLLLKRDKILRRRNVVDRRQTTKSQAFPVQDNEHNIIHEDRRRGGDRRDQEINE